MKRILFVDDDKSMRYLHSQMLEGESYDVHVACDGQEALDYLKIAPVDLVITDILMPEIDGFELMMEIRKSHPKIKVVAISGGGRLGPNEYLKLANQLGATFTLQKPYKKEELISMIHKILNEN